MNKHITAKKQSKTNCKGGSITDTQFKIAKQAVEYITKNCCVRHISAKQF